MWHVGVWVTQKHPLQRWFLSSSLLSQLDPHENLLSFWTFIMVLFRSLGSSDALALSSQVKSQGHPVQLNVTLESIPRNTTWVVFTQCQVLLRSEMLTAILVKGASPMSHYWTGSLGGDWILELGLPTSMKQAQGATLSSGTVEEEGKRLTHGCQGTAREHMCPAPTQPAVNISLYRQEKLRYHRKCRVLYQHPISPLPSLPHANPIWLGVRSRQRRYKWKSLNGISGSPSIAACPILSSSWLEYRHNGRVSVAILESWRSQNHIKAKQKDRWSLSSLRLWKYHSRCGRLTSKLFFMWVNKPLIFYAVHLGLLDQQSSFILWTGKSWETREIQKPKQGSSCKCKKRRAGGSTAVARTLYAGLGSPRQAPRELGCWSYCSDGI